MKKISYFALALTVLAAAASCEKNIEQSQDQIESSGELRQVTITAGSAQTRTSVTGGTLTWSENDKLNIVPQSGTVAAAALDIKSGNGTDTGTFEGTVDASVTDATQLYGWCGGDWTYDAGSFSVDMPATQTYAPNGLAENAYPSIGTGSITSGISLSNPMGVLKLSVLGAMAGDKVKSITVTSAANNLAGSFSIDKSTYAVTGGSSKTVTLNVASPYAALSLTDAVNFYIVVPPGTYAAKDLYVTVTFSDDSYSVNTFTDAVTVTAGNATAKEVSDHTGRLGTLNGQEYVLIRAKYDGTNDSYLKWATQNLAVTESGKAKWNGTNYQIGDYFQWAASYEGYGITEAASKVPANLVIYNSFTNTFSDSGNSFSDFRDSRQFITPYSSYANGYLYTKYASGSLNLEQSDDVANIVLGNTWRMPTGGFEGEFKAMYNVTYWTWDATDKGYYVFKLDVGTSGTAGTYGAIGTGDEKAKALLFFPAAGGGWNTDLDYVAISGYYWSVTASPDAEGSAYALYFSDSSYLSPDGHSYRAYGNSVRPVSD